MDEYRLLNKKKKKQEKVQNSNLKKGIISAVNKILICAVLVLVVLILSKNDIYKNAIYKYVYSYNLSFSEVEKFYKKHFGSLIPEIKTQTSKKETELVSSEKMTYESLEEVENGVKLKLSKSSNITALESGLVVFKGEKEEYGTTLILEQIDGIEAWYVGIEVNDLNIYDYVEKGTILGTSQEDHISLYFKKKGESVDYKNYLF